MLQPGQRLDDYRIDSLFASGGMGEIYLAEEVSLNRQVAIKVIRPEAIRYPDSEDAQKVTKLFRREATAIARLNHPYILPLFRFGEATIDGIPLMYMVIPYCEEKSLTDWMHTHGKTVFSPQEVDNILRQAAEALQYAHDQGVIHLDVKPSNFLVRYRADDASRLNLQLADFGVAKLTATTGMSQAVRGSLEYMAPEQWEGNPVFATDQYALATMTYKFLTGQAPFKGSGFEQLWHQHRYMPPQPPSTINPNIPPAIDAVLLRALAKNPSERFPGVMAFADAYHQALEVPKTERVQIPNTAYAPFYQTLMLSPEEVARGTYRTITLPSGEQLPISVPPGAYQGQVIQIPRQNAPTVIVSIQIPTMPTPMPPPPPPPITTPRPSPGPSSNKNMRFILAGLALVLIIGGIIVAVSVNNSNQQHNVQATATAQAFDQANQQTQAALNAQATQNALATANAQATQTAQAAFPNVIGSYSGTYQDSTASSSSPMSLTISQQNQQSWTGSCTLQGTNGSPSNFTISNGMVDQNGNITFSVSGTDANGNSVTVTFTSTQPGATGWTGTYTITNGSSGTWTVS
jgi:serine/threonine protein kinase